MKKLTALSFLLCFSFLLIPPSFGAGDKAPGATEAKIKKIVMMLNIATREYALGIADGKIINADEYEESQAFVKQALARYQSAAASTQDRRTADEFTARFAEVLKKMADKKNPAALRSAVKELQSNLLREFGIEMQKSPKRAVSLANGKAIYTSYCMLCHGLSGHGDGPLSSQLDPKPAVLADPEITGEAQTAAFDNFEVINVGIAGTAMRSWTDVLSEDDIWDVTYFIRTFSKKGAVPVVVAANATAGANAPVGEKAGPIVEQTRNLLAKSFAAFKKNQLEEASDLALDAYLEFEKIEPALKNKKKDLGLRLESSFNRFREWIQKGTAGGDLENLLRKINTDLSEGLTVLRQEAGATTLFIQSFSIIVREGFEAILIIAALIAFLTKTRNRDKVKTIYQGAIIGILASLATAFLFKQILGVSKASQEVMEGVIMLIAVVLLFSVSYWLVSKIEAVKWQKYISGKMQQAVSKGSAFTLGAVAFISVYREGFETVLFYEALYTYAGSYTGGIAAGFLAGCFCLAVIYYLTNQVGLRIPVNWFFAFTGVFLYYMAFVFMGKGLHELQGGGILSLTPIDFLPTVAWLGVYPSLETFLGQAVLAVAFILALIYTFGIKEEIETRELKDGTGILQNNLSAVHDLVEHISEHAKRCETFLKDSPDKDLKELSDHLTEIHSKVHELSDQVRRMGEQLISEYDRLALQTKPAKKSKP
ncbi:MAG: FTR1 family protein [Nitrospinales bacterium]